MAKEKVQYACQSCGAMHPKWSGQCGDCGGWNCLLEERTMSSSNAARFSGYAASKSAGVTLLSDVKLHEQRRISTTLSELDLVLGGGLIPGSVILIGGDPGIGKSTLLLQAMSTLSESHKALYITGEESLQQVTLRAERLGLKNQQLLLLAETQVERMLEIAEQQKPQMMVIDSIQTLYTDYLQSAPGGVGQVRECAAQLVRYAKQTQTILFLVGHVTKEGNLAGPRVLEHMVDTVLYFEGESHNHYRVIRAVKNRFGAVNELGVFAMTDKGLRGINNPSAIFLQNYDKATAGSVVMVTWEGSRPLLVEVQALVDESHLANPRRVTVGLEQNRLAMLLAVLHRHGKIATYNQDVFINIVGGMKVTETAADLASLLAVVSSLRDRPIPSDLVVFGEVGLAGEIRPVQNGQDRLREAAKLGFKRALIPKANAPKKSLDNIEVILAHRLPDALDIFS